MRPSTERKQEILNKFTGIPLKDITAAKMVLSGYRSTLKPRTYKAYFSIHTIINQRASLVRMNKIMSAAILKAIANPHLLTKH